MLRAALKLVAYMPTIIIIMFFTRSKIFVVSDFCGVSDGLIHIIIIIFLIVDFFGGVTFLQTKANQRKPRKCYPLKKITRHSVLYCS